MSDQSIEISEKQKNRFYFTNREIAMLAAFSVLLLSGNLIWILGPMVGNMIYGIIQGILLITAAIVIGKKYTILALGTVRTFVEIFVGAPFMGALTVLSFLTSAVALEAVLHLSKPYAANLKINVAGIALYGLVTRIMFLTISVFAYGMVLPNWLLAFMIIVPVVAFTIGGFLGHKIGNRVKNTVETI